ncbi:sugar transporter [uncultured Roseovarius sp.]|uniref:sugar transporter n=1 Tax=uncultured Roseovarius sp. TaxID=293344 RepID=UPI00260679B4|nr:sugar transporter [uncultured Roseovarius sp.]
MNEVTSPPDKKTEGPDKSDEGGARTNTKAAQAKTPPPSPNPNSEPRPPVQRARMRLRHVIIALSFVLWVIVPLAIASVYLYQVARDQYASHVGFSVRTEEVGSAVELLGGITELSGSSSSDTDILYEFIQSQQMVRSVNEQLDMQAIYRRPDDPVFTLGEDARVEALAKYWQRMVKIFYDRGSGLIELRVLAFRPEDARSIAEVIFTESSEMINELSAIARADATRYAEEELARAEDRLKAANTSLTAFRNRTQIVDPQADIQGQMGLLNSLNAQMAEAQIERELLLDNTNDSDPRVAQANRKMAAIQKLIDEERASFGGQGGLSGVTQYSDILEEYQALELERQFAEKSYLSALAARDAAVAKAQQQSRYLATHIAPTLAETPEYPRRLMLLGIMAGFLFVSWSILVMVYYSLRDRR